MNSEDIVTQYKNLGLILGKKHIDVVDRLKLDYVPNCVKNKEFCHLNHSKRCPSANRVDLYQSSKIKHFLDQNRPLHMLKIIEDMCLREEFPGEEAIFCTFELILKTMDSLYSTSYILDQCLVVVENLLLKFPPCWHGLRCCYKNILTTPQNTEMYLPGIKSSKQNIFEFVLTMLEQTMSENDDDDNDDTQQNEDPNTSSMNKSFGTELLNFHDWEIKEASKKSFNNLKRNDKLDRLFLIIYIITKLLELDLSVWMLRYASKNMQKHILDDDTTKPLVSFLFSFKMHNLITEMVKTTLRIYVNMIGFNYPENQVKIFSRLISILSVTMNLCEQSNSQQIIYPNIGIQTKDFVKAIFKIIDETFGRRVEIYLKIINYLQIPFIKYLLIDTFLFKINPDPGEMSVEKIVTNFHKKRWLQCSESTKDPTTTKIIQNTAITTNKLHKYPIVCTKNIIKTKNSEIFREEYLNILLDALKGCCDVYLLKNVLKLFKNDKNYLSEILGNNNNNVKYNTRNRKRKKEIKIKYNLEKVENEIDNYVKNLNTKKLKKLTSQSTRSTDNETNNENFDGIYVNEQIFLKFRKEIKFLMILKENIPKLHQKFGHEFDNFNKFIEEMFEI